MLEGHWSLFEFDYHGGELDWYKTWISTWLSLMVASCSVLNVHRMDQCNCWHFTKYVFVCMFQIKMMKERTNERKRRAEKKKKATHEHHSFRKCFFFSLLAHSHIYIYCKEKTDQTGAFGRLKKKPKSHMQILYNDWEERERERKKKIIDNHMK